MPRKLDHSQADSVAEGVLDAIDDMGYTNEEAIPGLIQAIIMLARGDDQMLDEAANLLADGGV